MTVALGLVCNDGVLIATDSMGSDGPVASESKKVRQLAPFPAVWTASGSVFVMEEVQREVFDDLKKRQNQHSRSFRDCEQEKIRAALAPNVAKTMTQAYARHTQPVYPGQPHPFGTDFLVLGYGNGKPWFLELAANGECNWHTERGFKAIGSGGGMAAAAQALMRHHTAEGPMALEYGMPLAYRVIDTVIRTSSRGVGPPVQMAVVDDSGSRIIAEDEHEKLKNSVAGWEQIERDALRGLTEASEGDADELPAPVEESDG